MDLVSMKRTRPQVAEALAPQSYEPEYPYGLKVTLSDDELSRLGMTNLPPVGQAMMLYARAEVSSTSAYESADGQSRRSVDLQITDLTLGPEPRRVVPEQLYPTMHP